MARERVGGSRWADPTHCRASRLAGFFFLSEFGDNNVTNSSARRNATPNLQIAEVLHRRADFVAQELITTRQLRVSTDGNALGDPLSRGPKYMNKFREEATKMGATSFVRMEMPVIIMSMLVALAALHPHVLQQESESREERKSKPLRPRDHQAQAHTRLPPSDYARSAR